MPFYVIHRSYELFSAFVLTLQYIYTQLSQMHFESQQIHLKKKLNATGKISLSNNSHNWYLSPQEYT